MMIIGIILAIILLIALKFFYDKYQLGQQVYNAGGMQMKFETLVDWFMLADDRTEIEKLKNDQIVMVARVPGSATWFCITQGFKQDVIIEWEVKNVILGNHYKKWTFKETMPQAQMAEIIDNELGLYNQQMMNNIDL